MARIVKQPQERRAEIVAAARRLLASGGYESTTMQDVMREVGIAKGAVYHYFRSKEELFEAVVEDIVGEATAQMCQALEAAQGSALDVMRAMIAAGRAAETAPEILERLHRPGNAGMHVRLLAAAIQQQAPLYAELIRRGCEQGEFRTATPLETAEFLLTAVQFLTDEGIHPWPADTLQRRAQAFPTLIETLLGAEPGSFRFLAADQRESDSGNA